jgi:hypothetical protein
MNNVSLVIDTSRLAKQEVEHAPYFFKNRCSSLGLMLVIVIAAAPVTE